MKLERKLLASLAVALLTGATVFQSQQTAAEDARPTKITVYKTQTCGCCTKWVDHLRANGFEAKVHDVGNLHQIKQMHGITAPLAACHTAVAGAYVIEGHVPADDIRRLLKDQPPILGITVPGMPLGSPGMEADRVEPYDVLAFDEAGNVRVFARH